jgi:hypothetical protein
MSNDPIIADASIESHRVGRPERRIGASGPWLLDMVFFSV